MSENLQGPACTQAEAEAAQKAGMLILTTAKEREIHAFAEAIREEQRARIAELELEIVPVREMLEDARMQFDMIREALGVSVEPHQSLFERVMESAQRVKALEQELKTERCLSFRNQVAELERKNEILTDAVSKSCSPFISTKEQLRICRDALAAAQPVARTCTDERPCINCFADQGECLGPYVSKEPASAAQKQEGGDHDPD